MQAKDLIGQIIYDTEKRKYTIESILGEGGQGVVYKTQEEVLIKINTSSEKKEYQERYKWLLRKSSTLPMETRIALPIAILAEPFIGYVMHEAKGHESLNVYISKPEEISSFSDWYFNASGGLQKRLQIGALLAKSLRYLHINGYAYVDISYNNILVAKNQNSIVIIDSDNITSGVYKPLIIGTHGYIAPEMLNENPTASSLTDTYSYAVLLFQILTACHPFIGEDVEDAGPEEEENAFKWKYPYIGDESETTNKNDVYEATKVFLTEELKELFRKTFVDGLTDSTKRPSIKEFMQACYNAERIVVKCDSDSCDAEYLYSEGRECPLCGKVIENPPRVEIREQIISKGKILIPHDEKKEFSQLPIISEFKGEIILKPGLNYIRKSIFDKEVPFELDKNVLTIKKEEDNLILYNTSSSKIYVRNIVTSNALELEPFINGKKASSINLKRDEHIVILDNNINLDLDTPITNIEEIEQYYGKLNIRKYLVVK